MSMRMVKVATVFAVVILLATPTWASKWRAELGAEPALLEEEDSGETVGRSPWPGPDGGLMMGGMCTYSWIDIYATGTAANGLGDDDFIGPFPIGFSFLWYGQTFSDFFVGSNGIMTFGVGSGSRFDQCPMPDAATPNNLIAQYWDDLDYRNQVDTVHYESFAAGSCPWGGFPGACLIVQFDNVCHYPSTTTCTIAGTWQTILFDDGAVITQYLDPGTESGLNATVGIEGDNAAADHGMVFECNVASLTPSMCLEWVPGTPSPVLSTSVKSASPSSAVPGEIVSYTIDIVNIGPLDASAATLVDPIPMYTTFAGGLFCSTGSCGYDGGAGEITWAGSVTSLSSETVTFDVMLQPGAPCGTPIVNTATIDDPGLITGPVLVEAGFDSWDEVPIFTDLEADDGGFVAGAGEWEWGVPTYPPDLVAMGAHSGVNVWGTNLDDDADDTIGNHVLSFTVDLPFTLPGYAMALQWWDWYGDEAADYRQIWINGVLEYEFPVGDQRFWAPQNFDLTPWAGQTVTIDFNLEVCCADPGPDGWYIDDIGIAACLPPPGLYLSPDVVTTQGCNGIPQLHTFNLANATGGAATFTMTYDNTTMNASVIGPPDIAMSDASSVDFDVELIPDACLGDGETVIVDITADGNSYLDISTINKTIGPPPAGWAAIAPEPNNGRMDNVVGEYNGLIWSITGYGDDANVRTYDVGTDTWATVGTAPSFGVNYGRSGCFAGDTVYVYGDSTTVGFAGLWAYNMDTGIWTNLTPTGTPPATTGIWAPAWAYNPADGYCYMTGGATVPGGGDLTTVNVYDPITDAWMAALPDFTGARAFHAAWAFNRPSDGHDLLCVGGGTDVASVAYADTQCYDFSLGAWNAPDADMGALPGGLDWWGMGFTNQGGNRMWLISGIIASGAVSDQAWFFDTVAGGWVDGGPIATGGYYRNAAATLNGEVYKISGSTGGFVYSGVSDRNVDTVCPTCADLAVLKDNGQVDVTQGTVVAYDITVDNIGPNDVFGATVEDIFPPEFTGVTWTCVGTGGGTCTASGAGDINDLVDLPVMAQVVYTATGTVGAGTTLTNTAMVHLPAENVEIDPANNSSTDSDPIISINGTLAGQLSYVPDLMGTDPSGFMVEATETTTMVVTTAFSDGTGNWTMDVAPGTYDVTAGDLDWLGALYTGASVTAGVTTNLPNPTLLGGDFDDSGDVGVVDITYAASRYGGGDLSADLNRSGDVDLVDVTSTASNYTSTAPVPWP